MPWPSGQAWPLGEEDGDAVCSLTIIAPPSVVCGSDAGRAARRRLLHRARRVAHRSVGPSPSAITRKTTRRRPPRPGQSWPAAPMAEADVADACFSGLATVTAGTTL